MQNLVKTFIFIFLSAVLYISPVLSDENDENSIEITSSDYNTTPYDQEIFDPFEPVNRVE
tara:strand:+ start:12924 stop:13103 length:180 start_codon:yes stop_codon:yes gene_type:complete